MATSDPARGLKLARSAVAAATALGDDRLLAVALRARAVALRALARWEESLTAFDAAAGAAERAGDGLLAAQVQIACVEALAQVGRCDDALALARDLQGRLLQYGAPDDAAKVLANSGNVYFQREEYTEALDAWEQARAFFAQKGEDVAAARLQMNIANVLTHLNRLPDAEKRYAAARKAVTQAGMAYLAAGLDGNLGYLLYKSGRYGDSLAAYARARGRFATLGLRKDVAQCDREAADVYLELNLIPEARRAFDRVLPEFASRSMAAESARAEMGLAACLAAEGNGTAAESALARAERAFRSDHNNIGVAQVRLQRAQWRLRQASGGRLTPEVAGLPGNASTRGYPGGAEWSCPAIDGGLVRDLRAALRVFRRQGIALGAVQARLLLAQARAARGACPVGALAALAREAESAGLISVIWRIETELARAHARAGRPRAALRHYRKAVDAVERVRLLLRGDEFQVAFSQDKTLLYAELVGMLLDRGAVAAVREAFRLIEQSRSRALLQLLDGSGRVPGAGAAAARGLSRRLERLREQLNWNYSRAHRLEPGPDRMPGPYSGLANRVESLEREYMEVQRRLQVMPQRPNGGPVVPDVAEIQAMLQPDEQLVEFAVLGDEVLAFVVGPRQLRTIRALCSLAHVSQLTDRLRLRCSGFGGPSMTGADEEILAELYEALLDPLQALLRAPRLRVVPHGVLHSVPFHALYDGAGYALDRWEIAYAPSAAVWRECTLRPEPAATGALLLGVSGTGAPRIRDEIGALARLLPVSEAYTDEAARLARVRRNAQYRYVHIATHGEFRTDNPLFSSLRLADGWLIAHDLVGRRLECSLATLSACRTGVHLVAPGDELLGLVRGFLAAGARAVMVSLWAAHDDATAELMPACYANLLAGMTRAAALRAAQMHVRERFPHPYHWAAFALVGAS